MPTTPDQPSSWPADLALAQRLADAADEISLRRFRAADLHVATKPDATPVTDADQAIEALIRRELTAARPADAVLGEEDGETGAGAPRRWVIDPIDGTKNFARGVPVWATLIALEAGADTVVGVISAPALGRRWWAARGGGAYARDASGTRPLQVSSVGRLPDASLSYSSLSGWAERGLREQFLALTDQIWRSRAYGDFWSHAMVAEGVVDVSAEPEVSRWDLAALHVLVTEAGGEFTALDGTPGPGGGSVVASNGRLHADVLRALAPVG
ncbi:MAG TPA: histidinol-phosphatase [Mycobacteriales bacterium]|nr:histidinol-phosphatase [Mycobacteriales bacterium]